MINTKEEQPVFQLKAPFKDPLRRKLFPMVKTPLERALLLDRINHLYRAIDKTLCPSLFIASIIKHLNIQYRLENKDIERIPRKGPAIVIMNHPFGGVEGIILASLLYSRRNDIKIMGNYLLGSIPELTDLFILVDPFGGKEALNRNIRGLREAIRWLENGGLLVIFPAGEVSHFYFNQRKIVDPPWNQGIIRIIKKTKTPVLPMFIKGNNGPLFQIAGLIHPRLRTALLPRFLLNNPQKEIEIRVGQLIFPKSLTPFADDREKLDYLRQRTYMLEHRASNQPNHHSSSFRPDKKRKFESIISPTLSNALAEEIRNLPVRQTLIVHGEYTVAFAFSAQIPHLLREIGRLRELTFRQAGEGTGKTLDLDIYDTFYLHLFLWNTATREIVGAYRIGPTDRLLNRLGRNSLYSQTLFTFHPSFFKRIYPALELGRSFVRIEYQKSYNALLLLWRGIGHFLARSPRYRYLFGTVSINQEYQMITRKLMVTYLKDHNYLPELAKLIKPKNPFPQKPDSWMETAAHYLLRDIEEVSNWVAELENEARGVPVLLKQYIKLGGKLLGFNIDPQFSNVLDGLILVDLTQTNRRVLERYLGKEGSESFLNFHGRALVDDEPDRDFDKLAA